MPAQARRGSSDRK